MNNNKIKINKPTILKSITFNGWQIVITEIEVSINPGIPMISIVGLPNKTVNESKERIKCVLSNLGISFPIGKIIINLSPGDLIKEGTHYDLAILCALLIHLKIISIENVNDYLFFGEVKLNGDIICPYGTLPVGIFAYKNNYKLITSGFSLKELEYSYPISTLLFTNIINLISYFQTLDENFILPIHFMNLNSCKDLEKKNYDNFYVLPKVIKNLLEIVTIGYHSLLLFGPPGTGKTTIAKIMKKILPPLTISESLEVSSIYSMCGLLDKIIYESPLRIPHSSTSCFGLLGGGIKPKPGEVSLAHKGILFLDEFNLFPSFILDSLRECLIDDVVRISRVNYQITYPAEFQLLAAMNPCKCGFFGSKVHLCNCSNSLLEKYRNKISGPLLDRLNIKYFLQEFPCEESIDETEWIELTKKKIINSREIIKEIFCLCENNYKISKIPFFILEKKIIFSTNGKNLLKTYSEKKNLSLRNYHNLIRLSTTISIKNNKEIIDENILSEAIFFFNDKNFF